MLPTAKPNRTKNHAMRGVNLGGWLVLEKWMTPSLFTDTDAADEYMFCDTADALRLQKLKKFRRTFITEDDFRWLQQQGIEAVRIPVGYWVFGDQAPYIGTADFLDKAFIWACKHDIKVLVCLHGAPGSQNGNDHSGRIGEVGWGVGQTVQQTLDILTKLVQRYQDAPALLGFELLNEPSPSLPKRTLKRYYKQAYSMIRRQCAPETWIVFSDSFQLRRWAWSLHWPWHRNAYLDSHQYQVFTPQDKALDIPGHMAKTLSAGRRLRRLGWHRRYIVGEWSAALDSQSLGTLSADGAAQAARSYMVAQMVAYDSAVAWFYWSYKTESGGSWSYRHMVQPSL